MIKVIVTNHHTPYIVMLSKAFKSVYTLNKFDISQSDIPDNIVNINIYNFLDLIITKKINILISNSAVRDLPIIILSLLFNVKVLIVIHGNIKHGWGKYFFGYYLKKYFYRLLSIVIGQKNLITISNHAKKELELTDIHVVRPFIEYISGPMKSPNNRLVISSNDIWRGHFDLQLLEKIFNTEFFDIHICGRGNQFLSDKYNVHEFNNKESYSSFLNTCTYTINILNEPESNYNISFLDCLQAGAIPIWIDRNGNELPNYANFNQIISHKDFDSNAFRDKLIFITDVNNHSVLKSSGINFLNNFTAEKFINSWRNIISENE